MDNFCKPEFYTVIQGENRVIPVRAVYNDYTPYPLSGVTEIRMRFKKYDGKSIEKRYSRNEIAITDANVGRCEGTLLAADTQLLLVGQRQDFSMIVDKGLYATVTYSGIIFKSDIPGLECNNATLQFDGVKTVAQVVSTWNTANPDRIIVYTGSGSTVPSVGSAVLVGGTELRRKVNFKRAISVEKEAIWWSQLKQFINILEQGDAATVKGTLKSSIDKIKSLCARYKVQPQTDLEELKDTLIKEIEDMKNKNYTRYFIRKKSGEDLAVNHPAFHKEYLEFVKNLKTLLMKYKETYPWIDVNSILEPIVQLEVR